MKNNKGYTLVELLVAMAIFAIVILEIFGMMNQSSKLYLNGTYEVGLQAEAQQIVQQMEELLIDANVSVSVNASAIPGVSVDTITIANNDVTYVISYEPNLYSSVSSGNLYIASTGSYTAVHELMAENVESISLDMSEYATTSRVTLNVVMRNDKYSYSTSKDIYLRNDIGISGNRAPVSTGGSYDEELDVLRFKQYNLSSMYNADGVAYEYAIQDGSGGYISNNADYVITNSGTTYYLRTQDSLNNAFNRSAGDFLIDAIDPTTHIVMLTIKISTQPVSVGADGFGLFVLDSEAQYTHLTPVRVEGVCLSSANTVTWQPSLDMPSLASNNYNVGSSTGFDVSLNMNGRATGDNYYEIQIDGGVHGKIDDDTNSIHFTCARYSGDGFRHVLEDNGMLRIATVFEFPNGKTLTVYSFGYVAGSVMSDTVINNFWSYCNSHKSYYN